MAETLTNSQPAELPVSPEQGTNIAQAAKLLLETGFLLEGQEQLITSVHEVTPYLRKTRAAQLIHTADGLDVFVRRENPDTSQFARDPIPTEWVSSLNEQTEKDLKPSYYLRGLFEQREKRIVREDGGVETVSVFTGPERFNRVMQSLGREPGKDCFKLVGKDVGKFTAHEYVEAAANLEIPVSRSDEEYIDHDRNLADHIKVWWSIPPEKAEAIRVRAQELLDGGDEKKLSDFTEGLDGLTNLTSDIIETATGSIDREWKDFETADTRVQEVGDFINKFTPALVPNGSTVTREYLYRSRGASALINMGFIAGDLSINDYGHPLWPENEFGRVIEDSPELVNAKKVVTEWAASYVRNVVDIWSRIDEVVGAPEGIDTEKRANLIEKLKAYLSPETANCYLEAVAHEYLLEPPTSNNDRVNGPSEWNKEYNLDKWEDALEFLARYKDDPNQEVVVRDVSDNLVNSIDYLINGPRQYGQLEIENEEWDNLRNVVIGKEFDERMLESFFSRATYRKKAA